METRAPADGTFQLVPSPEPGVWDFRVFCNYGVPNLSSAIAAGTTYANATGLSQRPHLSDATAAAYVAARREEVGVCMFWQNFVRALPTTPTITERTDPIFGRCFDHAYDDLASNTAPDVADTISVTAYLLVNEDGDFLVNEDGDTLASPGTAIVRAIRTEDLLQGLQHVVVTTAANAEVQKTTTELDEESGTMQDVTRIYTITATRPTASGLNTTTGLFTEVETYEHNIWLSTRRKASGLPSSRAAAVAWDTTGSILWPPVLQSCESIIILDSDNTTYVKIYNPVLREAFAGDVKVTKRRWFQYTPLTITAPQAMLPSDIRARGRELSVAIEPCLHGEVVIEEHNTIAHVVSGGFIDEANQMVVWTFAATAQTDWLETITMTRQTFTRGGYDCLEEIYYRPENYNAALLTVSQRAATSPEISLHV